MSKWILGLTIPVVFLSGLIPARAALLEYDFVEDVAVMMVGRWPAYSIPFLPVSVTSASITLGFKTFTVDFC